jgi:hypothetical protein
MRMFGFVLVLVGVLSLYGCTGTGKRVKTLVEEVCEQYGPASRECRDYRRSYLY